MSNLTNSFLSRLMQEAQAAKDAPDAAFAIAMYGNCVALYLQNCKDEGRDDPDLASASSFVQLLLSVKETNPALRILECVGGDRELKKQVFAACCDKGDIFGAQKACKLLGEEALSRDEILRIVWRYDPNDRRVREIEKEILQYGYNAYGADFHQHLRQEMDEKYNLRASTPLY